MTATARILALLDDGPMTVYDVACALGLTYHQAAGVLYSMKGRRLIRRLPEKLPFESRNGRGRLYAARGPVRTLHGRARRVIG